MLTTQNRQHPGYRRRLRRLTNPRGCSLLACGRSSPLWNNDRAEERKTANANHSDTLSARPEATPGLKRAGADLAAMNKPQDTDRLILIVDGEYVMHSLRRLLDRAPARDDRANYAALKRYAAGGRPGGYFTTARYFERRRPSGGFYDALERFGYELHLGDLSDGDWSKSLRAVKRSIVAELEELRATDHDVFYVGGDSDHGRITTALRALSARPDGSPRNVTVAHFDYQSNFGARERGELNAIDLVLEVEAVPRGVYDEFEQRTGRTVRARRHADDPQEQTALAAALQAASPADQDEPALDEPPLEEIAEAPEPPQADDAPDAQAPPEPAQEPEPPEQNSSGEPPVETRGLLVLIDHDDIDLHLSAIIDPTPLDLKSRPSWRALADFAEQRAQGGDRTIKTFLLTGGEAENLAHFHRRLGFESVLLSTQAAAAPDAARPASAIEAIRSELRAVRRRRCDVMIATHEGGLRSTLNQLRAADPERRIGIVGFVERINDQYQAPWIEQLDLERDIGAFAQPLPDRPAPELEIEDHGPEPRKPPAAAPTAPPPAPVIINSQLPAGVDPLLAAIAVIPGQKAQ